MCGFNVFLAENEADPTKFEKLISSQIHKFTHCVDAALKTLESRLYLKDVNHTFIQKNRVTLKNYSATNCGRVMVVILLFNKNLANKGATLSVIF